MTTITRYRKGITAAAGALAQVVSFGFLNGTALHVASVALAVLTALGVVAVPNARPFPVTAK